MLIADFGVALANDPVASHVCDWYGDEFVYAVRLNRPVLLPTEFTGTLKQSNIVM